MKPLRFYRVLFAVSLAAILLGFSLIGSANAEGKPFERDPVLLTATNYAPNSGFLPADPDGVVRFDVSVPIPPLTGDRLVYGVLGFAPLDDMTIPPPFSTVQARFNVTASVLECDSHGARCVAVPAGIRIDGTRLVATADTVSPDAVSFRLQGEAIGFVEGPHGLEPAPGAWMAAEAAVLAPGGKLLDTLADAAEDQLGDPAFEAIMERATEAFEDGADLYNAGREAISRGEPVAPFVAPAAAAFQASSELLAQATHLLVQRNSLLVPYFEQAIAEVSLISTTIQPTLELLGFQDPPLPVSPPNDLKAKDTHYKPEKKKINLLEVDEGTTAWWHEYGHYYWHLKTGKVPPGGDHDPNKNTTAELAFSEGFATFLGSWLQPYENKHQYRDGEGLGIDLESDTVTQNGVEPPNRERGAQNETTVASILWDLADRGATDDDDVQIPIETLLQALCADQSAENFGFIPTTLKEYLDQLKKFTNPATDKKIDKVAKDHGVS